MAKIRLETSRQIVPMIYCYSTPEIERHNGWVKIGYTEQTVEKRLKQQTHTADVIFKEEWRGNAVFDDGSGEIFKDTDFHAYLRKQNIENDRKNEWFKISGKASKEKFRDFRESRGILKDLGGVVPYVLRAEQKDAVRKTAEYSKTHEKGEFLWNAKPRFGKTLAVYDFCKEIDACNVLIVTNRPAIANSWYSDYEKFLGTESGYYFVSSTESLKNKPLCISRKDFIDISLKELDEGKDTKCIEFVSLQDLKGAVGMGGKFDKLKEVGDIFWDVLVIDEAHEGVDTYKTDLAFNHIKRRFTLHLSGTPFKALANDKFSEDAIFNWTYADEQRAKAEWTGEGENPYANLPKLNLFTYQMSEIIKDELEQGIEIQGETEEYAFDLNEFFSTDGSGKFVHESSVDKFLDALTKQEKFPFSTEELRKELKHTFWLLNRVDSAKALEKKLKNHPVFKDYKIVLAAGDGRGFDSEEKQTEKAFDKVNAAIRENEKTITLSVGQLTTGITIPQWSAVLMLSSIKSPALYMQAAFRAQNPCLFKEGSKYFRKENAYVFDFDPARTLTIFEEFANDLSAETSVGRGDSEKRKNNVKELLNFFPVIGEDEEGEMVELDAEKVLSIPRKIHAQEVVRRGFMSDFLFQNISNVFHAPPEIIEMIQQFAPVSEPKAQVNITDRTAEELSLDEKGEVSLTDDYVIGRSKDIFGGKIYSEPKYDNEFNNVVAKIKEEEPDEDKEDSFKQIKEIFRKGAIDPMLNQAKETYGRDLRASDKNRLERDLKNKADRKVDIAADEYNITKNKLKAEHKEAVQNCRSEEEKQAADREFKEKTEQAAKELAETLQEINREVFEDAGKEIVRTVETSKKEQAKKTIEDGVKDHLRGFSRTIPSFLMAYGNEGVTLESFDKIIPESVFKEVTSITIDNFKFLRDGGDYTDSETGETKYFEGKLFDPVVFNDSVKEFLNKKKQLANYFEEESSEDIFDYIPPQKTNQIFTPKWVVKKMADMLEEENPGCFDNPDKTFADLYMKSGLYAAEVVKRLYRSEKMKALYPHKDQRLKHIFEKQVYGLAPTEIIYKIALNFILGFDENADRFAHNFKLADALPYAKEDSLEKLLDELYPDLK
ncbi:MAG: DEAD/DEAH box helicase family protein [Clostridiales bacterium]|nr:DEAD/DEAH box helicase family protein [Clostridiales bacterium]